MDRLWRSKESGRARRGTTLADLNALFDTGVTARAIYEPLLCCLASDDARQRAANLQRQRFDVAGLTDSPDRPPRGFVRAADLVSGACGDHIIHFDSASLVAGSTPLTEVLAALRDAERKFVLEGSAVTGIVTRADLQKPPVRLLVFGLTMLLELHVTYLIRRYYPGETCRQVLPPNRVSAAQRLQRSRAKKNEDLDLASCLYIGDKCELLLAHSKGRLLMEAALGTSPEPVVTEIQALRNKLAHSHDLVRGSSWEAVIDVTLAIQKLLRECEARLVSRVASRATI